MDFGVTTARQLVEGRVLAGEGDIEAVASIPRAARIGQFEAPSVRLDTAGHTCGPFITRETRRWLRSEPSHITVSYTHLTLPTKRIV